MGAEAGLKNHLQAWLLHVPVHPDVRAPQGDARFSQTGARRLCGNAQQAPAAAAACRRNRHRVKTAHGNEMQRGELTENLAGKHLCDSPLRVGAFRRSGEAAWISGSIDIDMDTLHQREPCNPASVSCLHPWNSPEKHDRSGSLQLM